MQLFFTKKENLKNNRWDPNFWRSDLLIVIEQLLNFKTNLYKIGDISDVNIGQSGKRTFIKEQEIRYLVVGDLLFSGIHYTKNPKWVSLNGYNDPIRSRIDNDDILIVISGGGSIGRSTIAYNINSLTNISQDIAKVRLKNFPIYSTLLFLQSKWGVSQIHRFENGTGVTHLNQEEVKNILIPKFDEDIEKWSKEEFNKIKQLHNHALDTNNPSDWFKVEVERKKLINIFTNKILMIYK